MPTSSDPNIQNELILTKLKDTQFSKDGLSYFPAQMENLINFLSSALSLPDFLVDLRQSILIDFCIYNFEFCYKMGYTPEKAAALMYTFEAARQKATEHVNVPDNSSEIEHFFENDRRNQVKDQFIHAILEFSVEKMEIMPLSREQQELLSQKKARVAELEESQANAKKSKKTKKQLDEEADELKNLLVEVKSIEDQASIPRLRPPLFSEDDIREISNYFLQIFFEKLKMFYYVFNEKQQVENYEYYQFQREPAGNGFIPDFQFFIGKDEFEEKMKKENEEQHKKAEETKLAAKLERERREEEDRQKFEKLAKERSEKQNPTK